MSQSKISIRPFVGGLALKVVDFSFFPSSSSSSFFFLSVEKRVKIENMQNGVTLVKL